MMETTSRTTQANYSQSKMTVANGMLRYHGNQIDFFPFDIKQGIQWVLDDSIQRRLTNFQSSKLKRHKSLQDIAVDMGHTGGC